VDLPQSSEFRKELLQSPSIIALKLQSTVLDVATIRSDFPIFDCMFKGKPLAYLDNAATSQKPRQVIRALTYFYENYNANIHRGIYSISERATEAYENTRAMTAAFIGGVDPSQVIFTRNATESLNLVARSWGGTEIKRGDKIVLTMLEHHSNIVPWQMLAKEKGASVEYVNLKGDFTLDMDDFEAKVSGAKLLAVTHVSNVVGTVNPVKEMARRAHSEGAAVVVDGAQSCPHMKVNVKDMDCDFFAFSSHKMLGPTGVGILYGKRDLLEKMQPFLTGGDMISEVHTTGASWNELPWKFEAGTSNIADVIAFSEAIRYLQNVGMDKVTEHEKMLTSYALSELSKLEGVRLYGPDDVRIRGGAISFTLEGVHPHDLAAVLDGEGVAIRSGNHCAQPLHESLSLDATARASVYLYNIEEDIDRLVSGIKKASELMKR
jgi:cysteine desulfurase/selenocysteine lyase